MRSTRIEPEPILTELKRQPKSVLLEYLSAAVREMTEKQRRSVFGGAADQRSRQNRVLPSAVDPGTLRRETAKFRRDSQVGKYYRPFMIDSKNFMHVPEETTAWCDTFAKLTNETCQLTAQGEHAAAVRCFAVLYELLEAMENGDSDIVFAHELGGWMIPVDDKVWFKSYLTSLAAVSTPTRFAQTAAPILKMDSHQSFAADAYASAMSVASPQQRTALEAEIERLHIRIESARPDLRRR